MSNQASQGRIKYKTSHPLYGEDNVFDSWMTLCEFTIELAQKHISDENRERLKKLTEEMINTAEEFTDVN